MGRVRFMVRIHCGSIFSLGYFSLFRIHYMHYMHQRQKDCKIITRVTIIELKTEIDDLLSTGLKSEFVKDSKIIGSWFGRKIVF